MSRAPIKLAETRPTETKPGMVVKGVPQESHERVRTQPTSGNDGPTRKKIRQLAKKILRTWRKLLSWVEMRQKGPPLYPEKLIK